MHIVILDGHTLNPGDNPWAELAALGTLEIYERTSPEEVIARSRDAEILITNKVRLTGKDIVRLPRLRCIVVTATGFNVVDTEAARRRNIPVMSVPEYSTDAVAQMTFALILELCHRVGEHDRLVKSGEWTASPDFCFWRHPLTELAGKTMGIVGWGRIGRRVGEIASAFNMNVVAAGRSRKNPLPGKFIWREMPELFAESDVVSLHIPETTETRGMVNATLLARMKPDAFLINTSRGGLIVENDLASALAENRLAGAALDVVSGEPIRSENPLLHAPRCILTPHIAWATLSARRRLMTETARNIASFIAGQSRNIVNGVLLEAIPAPKYIFVQEKTRENQNA